ncbi:MAG TPA: MATE family efflux transporter [Vicinamibacteria bacterium]|nr:MATE family efflux transporter [Vicinamibacteria bacterium]
MRPLGERFRKVWSGPGGGREVLKIGYPLILGQMSFTLQVFVDRLFLTWYSPDAVAGAVTALFAVWTFVGLCIGTGEYATTFVAQYYGARRHERIGPAVWQGGYFCLASGAVIAALSPLAGPVFALAGHDPAVLRYEVAYAQVLMLGAFPIVLMPTLSSFFAGRGQTRVILVANVLATAVNGVLDYLWIFGNGGFPRAGVVGAALATVASQVFGCAFYVALMARAELRARFRTLDVRFEPALFARLVRYGLPAGLQYSLEIGAFALFMMIVGRIGASPLAASGIAFNLNMIVFMPMLGMGIAVSSLVGKYVGAGRTDLGERATWTAAGMAFGYMCACGLVYVLLPRLLLAPYAAGADPAVFGPVADTAVVLLRFIALYSIFDMLNVIFAAGVKGAGDTRYPLYATVVLSWLSMLVPAYVWCLVLGGGVYAAWTCASAYVVLLGLTMIRRFLGGRWKEMRVIEGGHAPELDGLETEPA